MNILSISIITVTALAVCALNGQTTGSVAGAVFENGAIPLAGATISYRGSGRMEKDPQGRMRYLRPEVFGSVKSRSDGTFSIPGLPPDRYTICAYGTLPVHISSCVWNTSDHRVSVASGQSVTGLKLNVTRGALLDITLTDLTGCAARYSKAPVYVLRARCRSKPIRFPPRPARTITGRSFPRRRLSGSAGITDAVLAMPPAAPSRTPLYPSPPFKTRVAV